MAMSANSKRIVPQPVPTEISITPTASEWDTLSNLMAWEEPVSETTDLVSDSDIPTLLRDLMLLKQTNETPQVFLEKIQQLKSLLYSNIHIKETDAGIKQTKRQLYDSLAIKALLTGLREPLGSFLKCKNPNSLETALQYIIEEENVNYIKNKFIHNDSKSNNQRSNLRIDRNSPHHIANRQTRPINPHSSQQTSFNVESAFAPRQSFSTDNCSNRFNQSTSNSSISKQTHNGRRNNQSYVPEPMDTSSFRSRSTFHSSKPPQFHNKPHHVRQPNHPRNRVSEELHYLDNTSPEENYFENSDLLDHPSTSNQNLEDHHYYCESPETEYQNFHEEGPRESNVEKIEINIQKFSKLQCIYIPQFKATSLVDTGAGRTLIKPRLAYKYFPNSVRKETFEIQTAHSKSQHDEVAIINIPAIFKSNLKHKFHLFDFDNKYDATVL